MLTLLYRFFQENIYLPIVNTIFPNFCSNCQSLLNKNNFILCLACLKQVRILLNQRVCRICSLYYLLNFENLCTYCETGFHKIRYFNHNISIFAYEGIIQNLIIKGKFERKAIIFKFLAKSMLLNLQNKNFHKKAIFIPVPIFKKRYHERGFNQSNILAKVLSRALKIPYSTNILSKIKNTQPQSQFKNQERLINPSQAYAVKKVLIPTKTVYLIDDVFTTGSTVNECAKVLKQKGVQKVISLTVAKA